MREPPLPQTLFVGVGSPHGDDRVGWLIAERLRTLAPPQVEIRAAAAPSDLFDWLAGVDRLVVCDACAALRRGPRAAAQAAPVALRRWTWPTPDLAELRSASSHSIGLPEVLRLAQGLGILPRSVTALGVPGRCFDAFAAPAPEVEEALQAIIEEIAALLIHDTQEAAAHA